MLVTDSAGDGWKVGGDFNGVALAHCVGYHAFLLSGSDRNADTACDCYDSDC